MKPILHFIRSGTRSLCSRASRAMALVLLGVIAFGLNPQLHAYTQANLQTAADNTIETIPLEATVQVSPAQITIKTYAPGTFSIYRKDPAVNTWTSLNTGVVLAALGTWTDNTVSVGTPYEYRFVNTSGTTANGIYPTGYIICGIQVDQTQPKGIMALVVASDLPVSLPAEYAQYKADLVADGWNVREIQVPRAANYNGIGNGAIATVKVNAGGTGSTSGTAYLTNSNGNKAVGVLTASSSTGAITAVSMVPGNGGVAMYGSAGAGFAVGDVLTISGFNTSGTGASLTAHIDSTQSTLGYANPIKGGSGYTTGTVTLTGQTSGKTVQCTLQVYNGAVNYFTVGAGQTGFVVGELLTMSGNTTGSGVGPITVYSVTSGSLAYAQLHSPGTGYQEGDTATLTGNQSGKTAQVTLHLDTSGYISYITLVSSQTGFIAGETLSLTGGSGTGAPPFSATMYGPLQTISVNAGGAGYVNGNVVTITYGSATAQGVLSVTGGAITGVTITSSGPGFYDGGGVSLSGLVSAATGYNLTVLTVDNSHAGRAVNITGGGSGYSDNDTVAIKGATSGAAAIGSLIAVGGTISGVSVVLPNTFTPGESLTLTPSLGGSGAVATSGTALENHLLIRRAVQAIYNTYPGQLKNVVMVGKVPVCRSGINDGAGSDGHGNEAPYGADAFYADMDGVVGTDWTDTGDNSTSVNVEFNLPGDKQFDQQTISQVGNGLVELGFGRIDLSLGIQTEVEANRTYFGKLHRYKTASPDFLPGRMVCDRLTYANEREADLQSMPGVVGMNNIQFIGTANLPTVVGGQDADQLYSAQNGPFLFYFKGSGGPAGGIGGKAVFWTGMQSHWGYWYQGSLLSSGANSMQLRLAENSFTLDFTWNIWGMRYIYHRMGMGFDAGDMMKQSINNQGWSTGPYTYKFNNTSNGDYHGVLYMNQMGDPALRLFMFAPPSALSVVKTGGNPVLSWTASTDSSVIGYHVYRAANANGFFTRLTSTLVTGSNTYTDSTVTTGKYVYMVRAIHLEATGGGTFYNPSLGITQAFNLDSTTPISNVTSSLPAFYWNTSGSATLSAQGGVPQYSWTITSGTLPAGLTLSSAGVISGTPTAIGNFPITVQATDQISQTKPQALTLTVNSSSQSVINPIATTYTAQNLPTTSYGTAETDAIGGTVGSAAETFHRYDLSGLNAYNAVTQATLYLYVTANTGTTAISDVQASLIADAVDGWVSNGIAKPFSGAAASPTSGWTRINCPNHGFTNGTQVTLAGLTGFPTTAYAITSIDANNFDIHITYGGWAYDPALAFATTLSMCYNTRPTTYDTNVPTLIATGTDAPGTLLQFDVTSYVREVLTNFPSKQMGIRFFTGTPQTVYVGSLSSFGGSIPYLVVQTSNAPNIVINSPTLNPAFINVGQGIRLNATVTPLPSRAASLLLQWSKVSGPGTASFTDPTSAATGATFSAPGDYVLQLTANDGVTQSSQTVTVRVLTIPVTGPATGMVLRLPLDETSGTIAHDVSGVSPANSGSLACVSGTTYPVWSSTGGVIGGALSLSGSSLSGYGQQIVVPDSATNPLDGMSQMSISLWLYANSINPSGSYYNELVSKRHVAFNSESYSIGIRGGAGPFSLSCDAGKTGLISGSRIALGKWYHAVLVFDGTLSTQNLKLYINGNPDVFVTSYSSGTIPQTTVPRNTTADLHIGAYDYADTNGWNGMIDEVRIYNRALSLSEIQDLYAAVPSDIGPVITTAPALSGSVGQVLSLNATVTDDSKPTGALTYGWSELSGPFSLTIANPAALSTTTLPGAAGLYGLQFAASDGAITTFANVNATITGQTFASWATANSLTGPNASNTACPAGDGVSNLMKYALGLDPNRVCTALTDGTNPGLPLVASDASNLSLTYQRDTAKTDISYLVEAGTDLTAWSNNGVTEQILSTNGTVQTVKASVLKGSNSKEFIHLRVVK